MICKKQTTPLGLTIKLDLVENQVSLASAEQILNTVEDVLNSDTAIAIERCRATSEK